MSRALRTWKELRAHCEIQRIALEAQEALIVTQRRTIARYAGQVAALERQRAQEREAFEELRAQRAQPRPDPKWRHLLFWK